MLTRRWRLQFPAILLLNYYSVLAVAKDTDTGSWCMILNEQWALVLVAACDDRRQFASDDLNTESGFLSPRFLESGSTSVVTNIPLTRSLVWIDHRMPCFSELSYVSRFSNLNSTGAFLGPPRIPLLAVKRAASPTKSPSLTSAKRLLLFSVVIDMVFVREIRLFPQPGMPLRLH